MLITQEHITFYREKKVPALGLQALIPKKTKYAPAYWAPVPTIHNLINNQTVEPKRKCVTEPHNINNFIRGWRARKESIRDELYRLAYFPYSTDPKRRTAYAKKWYQRIDTDRIKQALTQAERSAQ